MQFAKYCPSLKELDLKNSTQHDLASLDLPVMFEHVFCELIYDRAASGALTQLQKTTSALEKNKGKLICETVEIFAGCGGLLGCSKLVYLLQNGLLNMKSLLVFVDNCNVIIKCCMIMQRTATETAIPES